VATKREHELNDLVQIERVLFLQDVALFSHCTAAEILRIAAIANERRFAAGETVYEVDDAAETIHCVVEGVVGLENAARDEATASPGDAFGLIDILSGRLRTARATAETDTPSLAINADDFFDLMSNNIGIVRALVHFLSDRVPTPLAW